MTKGMGGWPGGIPSSGRMAPAPLSERVAKPVPALGSALWLAPSALALVIKDGRAYYPAEIHEALGIRPFAPALKVQPAR